MTGVFGIPVGIIALLTLDPKLIAPDWLIYSGTVLIIVAALPIIVHESHMIKALGFSSLIFGLLIVDLPMLAPKFTDFWLVGLALIVLSVGEIAISYFGS